MTGPVRSESTSVNTGETSQNVPRNTSTPAEIQPSFARRVNTRVLQNKGPHAAIEHLATSGVDTQPHATAKDIIETIEEETEEKTTGHKKREKTALEKATERNNRLASALHTLIVSISDRDKRNAFVDKFPVLDDDGVFDVDFEMIIAGDSEQAAAQIQTRLHSLVETAIDTVGGLEQASLFLSYPGLADNESLGDVRGAPDEWFHTSLSANTFAPQMNLGILTKLGQKVLGDIIAGTKQWDDVVYAYLTNDQLLAERVLVSKLHGAFLEQPAMPAGHEHPKKTRTIQDSEFQKLWRGEMKSILIAVLRMAKWAEDTSNIHLPPADISDIHKKSSIIDPNIAERLRAFLAHPQLRPYVEMTMRLYQASANALDSEEGVALQRLQRRENTTRKPSLDLDMPAVIQIDDFIKGKLAAEVDLLKSEYAGVTFPTDLATVFLSSLAYPKNTDSLEYPPIT